MRVQLQVLKKDARDEGINQEPPFLAIQCSDGKLHNILEVQCNFCQKHHCSDNLGFTRHRISSPKFILSEPKFLILTFLLKNLT